MFSHLINIETILSNYSELLYQLPVHETFAEHDHNAYCDRSLLTFPAGKTSQYFIVLLKPVLTFLSHSHFSLTNTVILVSLACVLYGELDVTINRAKILVESLVSVSLKHTLESSTYLRHQQGVTGEVDKPCSSMLAMTRSLTTVLIGNPTGQLYSCWKYIPW